MVFKFCMNRVALIEFLNTLDSGSSCELAIDTYKFLLMLRTTKSCKEALVLLRCLFVSFFFMYLTISAKLN